MWYLETTGDYFLAGLFSGAIIVITALIIKNIFCRFIDEDN